MIYKFQRTVLTKGQIKGQFLYLVYLSLDVS